MMNESYEVIKERNDKNKAFRKRLKNFYIGLYGVVGVMILCALTLKSLTYSKIAVMIGIGVVVAIFVVWIVWCVVSGSKIRCPHCNRYIGRSNPWNITKCPYCGTSLEVLQYYGNEEL